MLQLDPVTEIDMLLECLGSVYPIPPEAGRKEEALRPVIQKKDHILCSRGLSFKVGSTQNLDDPESIYTRQRKFSNTKIFLLRKNTGLCAMDSAFRFS